MLTAIPLLLLASSVLDGIVLTRLWAWFASSALALPVLSLSQALGLVLIIRLLARMKPGSQEERQALKEKAAALSAAYRRDPELLKEARLRAWRYVSDVLTEHATRSLLILAAGWALH